MGKDRKKSGRFAPGHKGFKPTGRDKYAELKKMAWSKEPELLEALFDIAIKGNITALIFILNKLYGSGPIPDGIGLTGKTTAEQVQNLNRQIKAGAVSASEVSPLLDLVKVSQLSVEIEELKAMVKKVELNVG